MTELEALIYFPEGEEGLEDSFSEKMFETKQFLISRFPISKLYSARVAKLKLVQCAYEALGGITTRSTISQISFAPSSNTVKSAVSTYTQVRNTLKMQLLQVEDVQDIEIVVNNLLSVTADYAKLWVNNEVSEETVIVGKEPDPMVLIDALSEIESNGCEIFDDLSNLDSQNALVKEFKRLSLWLKLEANDG